ncbi:MAG: acyltransferase domain-containing protein, partial [Candidatus Eremiobacteraeota bacterium]|nr:acyltransferase domain-containing protein [Candidatus Eremiobacteraeota bacterium]
MPVAIIGMAALMPKARTLREFWTNILDGSDGIGDLPASRWDRELYYDPDPNARDRTCAHRGGFIPETDFDPLEFGIPPATLASIDPAQLLSLVVARDALRDAGYPAGGTYDHRATAVILGVVGTTVRSAHQCVARTQIPEWTRILRAHALDEATIGAIVGATEALYPEWTEDSFPGYLPNVVPGRIANRLDLGGMTCAVDAACASSLSAVAHAVAQIEAGRCDLAITGGVDVDNSTAAFISFAKTHALSPSQRLRPFAEGADGTLLAEGIGFLVLKDLAQARADGDRVYAVIAGIGAASDGRSTSIYAPRPDGQTRALREAYAAADVPAVSVGLVEAHATGTEVGDRVEFAALSDVFAGGTGIALGSIKSQIGHAKAAAGAAGLIKAALALHHRVLAPTRIDPESAYLDLSGSPFCYVAQAVPWPEPAGGGPRRAGVSSFGFGGANYHVVLEEAAGRALPEPSHARPFPLIVSAPNASDLRGACTTWLDQLRGRAGAAAFRALAAGSNDAVPAAHPRLGFVATDADGAAQRLAAALQLLAERGPSGPWNARRIAFRPAALSVVVVALFPGQGSQYVGMGARLAAGNPAPRAIVAAFDQRFAAAGDRRLSAVMLPPRASGASGRSAQDEALRRTLYAQAAVGAHSAGLFRMLEAAGLRVDAAAGHSFGELTALWAAGALDDTAFIEVVRARGEALTPGPLVDAGTLVAVQASRAEIEERLTDLSGVTIANVNAARQLVLGGSSADVARAEARLTADGFAVARLPVAAAFHTALVGYAEPRWRAALERIVLRAQRFPGASNTTGSLHDPDPLAVSRALALQPFRPVLFERNIEALYALGGRIFIEIGPRAVLTRLVGTILADREHVAIDVDCGPDGDAEGAFGEALMRLRVAGVPLAPVPEAELPPAVTVSPTTIRVGGALVGEEARRASLDERLALARVERDAYRQPAAATAHEASPVTAWLEIERTILDAHERFLAYCEEQTRLVMQAGAGTSSGVLDAVREQHADTVRVHEQFLHRIDGMVRGVLDAPIADVAGDGPTRTARPKPAAQPAPPLRAERLAPPAVPQPRAVQERPAAAVLVPDAVARGAAGGPDPLALVSEIVAAKTGYPVTFLRPEMELEADLGLDSIKRVEVFANLRVAVSERYGPGVLAASDVPPESLAAARSLGALAEIIVRRTSATARPAAPAPTRNASAAVPLQLLEIVELGTGAAPSAEPPAGATVLLADGSPLTAELARLLDERGRRVVVFHPAATSEGERLDDRFDQLVLGGEDRRALGTAFDLAARLHGTIGSIIVVHPEAAARRGDPLQRARLQLALLCVAEGASRPDAVALGAVAFVARLDGRLATSGTAAAEPAALAGLARTVRCEFPALDTRFLDVD